MLPSVSVLFVEDSGVEKNRILEALKRHFTIEIHALASTTDEFHELLTGRHWDMVVSEEYLSKTDAFEILDIINASGREIPVFVFSAYSDVRGAVECVRRGAADFRTKDDIAGLMESVSGALSRKKVRREDYEEYERELLTDMIEESRDLIFLIDEKSLRFRYVNRAVIEKTEYSFGELRGMTPVDLVRNLSAEVLRERLTGVSEGEQDKIVLFTEIVSKTGKVHQSEATVQLVYRKNENLFYARLEDLSEKIRTHENAMRMMQVVEHSTSGIFVTEKDGTVTYANPKLHRQTGFGEKDIIGQNIKIIKNIIEDSEEYDRIWATVLSGRRWAGRTKSITKDGGQVEVLSFVSPIRNSKGEITNLAFFDEDATLANEMKMQLIHAQKMETLGELAGGIAHDFNNVLTAIGGFASVISRKLKDRKDLSYLADKLVELSESGRALTQGLLGYSRKQEQEYRIIELERTVRKVTDIISLVFPEDIVIDVEMNSGGARIRAVESQIEQILLNLANNARDAMPDGGLLTVASSKSPSGKSVLIRIGDTGTGMPADVLANIFKPFFTTKSEGKGTGLGLAIVKDLMDANSGKIVCDSILGHGTVFTLEFPFVDIDEISCAAATSDSLVKLKGSVVVIDDDPGVREGIETMLEEFGYRAVSFDGYPSMYNKLEHLGEVSLAVIDMVLADSGSVIAAEALLEKYGNLPIIYMTGYDDESLKGKGIGSEGKIILRKPVFAYSLLKAIAEAASEKSVSGG
ncbi:PAS domain S-box protein [Geovibrio thiophilus]|uniref:histidine kinase n=1 Tax=Geovibrio thiophilus TaxID=139438 RepID=A0A3R6AW82_9BACT|nr:PAS domain-containing sensor histidine kinase [Geovibrio thiophilus]QAR31965.1 PAS domain S-box protein [Geovibrio thiophilus]